MVASFEFNCSQCKNVQFKAVERVNDFSLSDDVSHWKTILSFYCASCNAPAIEIVTSKAGEVNICYDKNDGDI